MSDHRHSRRPWVIAGYSMSAVLRPLTAIVTAAWQVVGMRIADRVAKGLRTAPRDAMIADSVEIEHRAYAFSFHRGLDHLGAAIGGVLAFVLLYAFQHTHFPVLGDMDPVRIVLAIATIPAVIGVVVLLFSTVEVPSKIKDPAPRGPGSKPSLRVDLAAIPREMYMPLAALLLFALGNASDGFLLFLLHDVGFPKWSLPLAWSGFHVVKYATATPGGQFADRVRSKRMVMVAGWLLYAAVYVGFAFIVNIPQAIVLLAIYAVHYALTEGTERAMMIELAAGRIGHGTSLGSFHFVIGIGAVLSSVIFGLIYTLISREAAFLTGGALALAAAVLLAMTGRGARELPHAAD